MYVRCVESLVELERYASAWDALAGGCVFRSWTWASTWWRHYGVKRRASRSNTSCSRALNGSVSSGNIASRWGTGRVLRLLGDGEACSDHVGLIALSAEADDAGAALAAVGWPKADSSGNLRAYR